MKLRRLELEHFRKFNRPVAVAGLSDGLNLLCGPNEAGKSTLLMALQAAFFERHRAGGEQVRQLRSLGARTGPRVAVDFELDDRPYRIEKRFLAREMARLDLPGAAMPKHGDEAEDELQRLLDFERAGNRGPAPEQLGAWGLLWVGQGASCQAPEVGERARRSLEDCLIGAFETLVGTSEARVLWQRLEDRHRELESTRGPRARYRAVIDKVAELDRSLHDLRARQEGLKADVEALDRVRRRLRALEHPDEDARLDAERTAARQDLDRRRALDDRCKAVAAEFEVARSRVRPLAAEIARRRVERAAFRDEELALDEATPEVAETAEALAARIAAVNQLRSERGRLEGLQDQLGARLRRATNRERLARCEAELIRLREHRRAATVAEQEARELAAAAARIALDDQSLARIRQAASTFDHCQAALEAAAPLVRFDLEPSAEGSLVVDGIRGLGGRPEREVLTRLEIEIDGIGRIQVVAAGAASDALLRQRREAEMALVARLGEAGVANVEEAALALEEKKRLLGDARLKRQSAGALASSLLTGGQDPGDLDAAVERLAGEVEALRLRASSEEDVPAAGEEADAADLERRTRELDATWRALQRRLEEESESLARARQVQAEREADLERARRDLERRRRRLAEAESERADAVLESELCAAEAAVHELEAAHAALEEQAHSVPAAMLEARLGRIEGSIGERQNERADLRVEVGRIEERIVRDEGAGLGERILELERQRAAFSSEQTGIEREVSTLALLKEVIEAAEDEARDCYQAPVVARLRPYLGYLFPGALVKLDNDFRIETLTRGPLGPEPLDQLSDGTREQIAVITRLAFAEMLAERGRPAVVVLDDALAFSDEERLGRMFDILMKAAEKVQILVLTCRERAFHGLAATRLRIEEVAETAVA